MIRVVFWIIWTAFVCSIARGETPSMTHRIDPADLEFVPQPMLEAAGDGLPLSPRYSPSMGRGAGLACSDERGVISDGERRYQVVSAGSDRGVGTPAIGSSSHAEVDSGWYRLHAGAQWAQSERSLPRIVETLPAAQPITVRVPVRSGHEAESEAALQATQAWCGSHNPAGPNPGGCDCRVPRINHAQAIEVVVTEPVWRVDQGPVAVGQGSIGAVGTGHDGRSIDAVPHVPAYLCDADSCRDQRCTAGEKAPGTLERADHIGVRGLLEGGANGVFGEAVQGTQNHPGNGAAIEPVRPIPGGGENRTFVGRSRLK